MSERYDQDDSWQNRIAAALQAVGPSESIAADSDSSIEARLDAVEADPFSEAEVDRILGKARQVIRDQSLAGPAVARDEHSSEDSVSEDPAAEDSGMVGDDPMKRTVRAARGVDGNGRTASAAPSGMSSVVVVVSVCASLLAAVGLFQVKRVIDEDLSRVVTQNHGASLVPVNAEVDSMPGLKPQPRPEVSQLALVDAGSTIQTGEREKRRVQLPDGSVVYVNEQTRVTVLEDRGLKLHDGEVFVEVMPKTLLAADLKDDFIVQAADRSVRATGTRFAVSADGTSSDVLVTQGSVQVSDIEEQIVAGQELFIRDGAQDARYAIMAAPRASESLSWTRDLVTAADAGLVPESEHAGGSITVVDPNGQEMRLSLRTVHVDVHIEDGFARTTIDQTYFNHTFQRQEGTFHFPLPADASLSRLAMYVNGKLMEGGMAERQHARNVFEQIRYTRRDPALLEWVDGSTFKMRVFPLEPRQEKRIVLSYTQRLPNDYGKTVYRFPAGHSLERVRDWSTRIQIAKHERYQWDSPSHVLNERDEETESLVLEGQAKNESLDRDLVVELRPKELRPKHVRPNRQDRSVRFSSAEHEAFRYLMLRFRPELEGELKRATRNWVFLFETTGDRNPLLARVQIDVIRTFLENAEHDDTFSIIRAGTKSHALSPVPQACSPKNIEAALARLEDSHLVGALDFGKALDACQAVCQGRAESWLVHVGSAIPVIGERDAAALLKRIPNKTKYVGVGVGNRWAQTFMRSAASQTGGHFTQINPDEEVGWRAFELYSTLSAPRLLEARANARNGQQKIAFLNFADTIAHGQEFAAVTRLPAGHPLPKTVTVAGMLNGDQFEQTLIVADVEEGADYLPRTWARLEIDRLVGQNAEANKQAIISLSKAMYVMSPFTSLLVLETEQMYKQFAVDRGRKDHWALYPAQQQIKVVHEPDVQGPVNLTSLPDVEQQLSKVRTDRDEARAKLERSLQERKSEPLIGRLKSRYRELDSGAQLLERQVSRLKKAAENKVAKTAESVVFRRKAPRGFGIGKVVKPQHVVWTRLDPKGLGESYDIGSLDYGANFGFIADQPGLFRDGFDRWGIQTLGEPAAPTAEYLNWNVQHNVWTDLDQQRRTRRRRMLLDQLNRRGARAVDDHELQTRIAAYELAYRMQTPNLSLLNSVDLAENGFGTMARFAVPRGSHTMAMPTTSGFQMLTDQPRAWHYSGRSKLVLPTQSVVSYDMDVLSGLMDLDGDGLGVRLTGPQIIQNNASLTFTDLPAEYRRSVDSYFLTVFGRGEPVQAVTVVDDSASLLAIQPQRGRININTIRESELLFESIPALGSTLTTVQPAQEQLVREMFVSQVDWSRQNLAGFATWRGPRNVPVALHVDSVLGELVSHAPGLETTLADALSVLESEGGERIKAPKGDVEPKARTLIENARSLGWETVIIPGEPGRSDLVVHCDGQGRFRVERFVSEQLKEVSFSNGTSLWHIYPELGLAAQRSVSRFHRADLSSLIPWIVLPVDDLRIGADVKLVDRRTVAVIPKLARKADDETRTAAVWHVHLVFAEDGRLAERRTVEAGSGKVTSRLVIGGDGRLELISGDGESIAQRTLKRTPLNDEPNLVADAGDLVVLPLPYRAPEAPLDEIPAEITGKAPADTPGKKKTPYANLSEEVALRHVAAAFAAGNGKLLYDIIDQRFLSKKDRRVGFLVLLSCAAPKHNGVTTVLKARNKEPLPQFLSQYHAWRGALNLNVEFVVNPQAPEFVQRLAEGHNHFVRWVGGRATKDRTDAQIRDELGRVLVFVRRCRNPMFAWQILSSIHSRLDNEGKIEGEFGRRVANELARLEKRHGARFASSLQIRWLLQCGQTEKVAELHQTALIEAVKPGGFPGLHKATYELFKAKFNSTAAWQQSVQAVAELLQKEDRRRELLALAEQCRNLGETELGDGFFTRSLDGIDLNENVDMLAAAFEYSRRAEKWEQAEQYAEQLLNDRERARLGELWRRASEVSTGLGDADESLRRLEHAMNLEFEELPEQIDLTVFSTHHSVLFDSYDAFVKSTKESGDEFPRDFANRVIHFGDRWRELAPDNTTACQRVARVLNAIGQEDLAWSYWTTPLGQNGSSSDAWWKLAREMRDVGWIKLAGNAYEEAFTLQKTNPQILLEHAQMLVENRDRRAGQTLLNQIARGSWQPRFQQTKQKALNLLSE